MTKLKVLICGDFTCPVWHPMKDVAGEMASILEKDCDITFDEHMESYSAEGYAAYDVCIFHIENYMEKQKAMPWLTGNLVTYARNGGRLFLPHVPSILSADEISRMFGCRFVTHPPMDQITFRISDRKHPIAEGAEDFTVMEECHQLILTPDKQRDIFLMVDSPEGFMPAGWSTHFGAGKLVYLMPGHHAETYHNEEFRKLFLNAVLWLGGRTTA